MTREDDYSALYPTDFFFSRERFLAEALRLDATVTSLPIHVAAPHPYPGLSIDIALIGDPRGCPTLVYIAGTHGIEGFVGSAIQHAILSQLNRPPREYALAFVHCLNPWGMLHLRRTNEHNVDLNRNCTASDEERLGAPPGYDNIRHLLIPDIASSFPRFCFDALAAVLRYGFPAAKQAVTGGQYIDQHGLFFGGLSLQQELHLLRSWAEQHLTGSTRVLVVDIHSGLGAFCQDFLIVDSHEHSASRSRIAKLFPNSTIHGPDPAHSLSYETRGSIGALFPSILPDATIDYVVHEFGTLHSFRVLYALVQENFHHFMDQQGAVSRDRERGSALLKEAFCPPSLAWRSYAVRRGLDVFRLATTSLSGGL